MKAREEGSGEQQTGYHQRMSETIAGEEACLAKRRCLVQLLLMWGEGDALPLPELLDPAQAVAETVMVGLLLIASALQRAMTANYCSWPGCLSATGVHISNLPGEIWELLSYRYHNIILWLSLRTVPLAASLSGLIKASTSLSLQEKLGML